MIPLTKMSAQNSSSTRRRRGLGRSLRVLAAAVLAAATTLGALPAAAAAPSAFEPAAAASVLAATTPSSSAADFPPGTPVAQLPLAVAWGYNNKGQLGVGNQDQTFAPVAVTGGTGLDGKQITVVDVGGQSGCAITAGVLYCWGDNQSGQVGIGSFVPEYTTPQAVVGPWSPKSVTKVSVGRAHVCAVAGGKAYCWGSNSAGQVGGSGNFPSTPLPSMVTGFTGMTVSDISAGDNHTCAIANGKAYCWGANNFGQLGVGTTTAMQKVPLPVSTSGPLAGVLVTSISAAARHTCASAAGSVSCWGSNASGQLGSAGVSSSTTPLKVADLLSGLTVDSLSTGGDVSCVVAGTGAPRKPYCWGVNTAGQLGSNTTGNTSLPKAVYIGSLPYDRFVSSVSVNAAGGCMIYQGSGYCWGADGSTGRLGNGYPQNAPTPSGLSTSGALSGRRMQTIASGTWTTAGIAVTAKAFPDVPEGHQFRDDISWLSGSGIAQGYSDGKYHPAELTDRQAMSAFVFRMMNPGLPIPACNGMTRRFVDVPKTQQFCGAIEWLVDAGVIVVPANKKFQPLAPITRSTMADFLFRAHHPGVPDRSCTGSVRRFPDVSATTASCGNIEWLAGVGVTAGYANGTYGPDSPVDRQAMSAFMHRHVELSAH